MILCGLGCSSCSSFLPLAAACAWRSFARSSKRWRTRWHANISSARTRMSLTEALGVPNACASRKEPFFHGHDNYDQLVKIAKVLGPPAPLPAPWAVLRRAQPVAAPPLLPPLLCRPLMCRV
jgi:hypothetical protein